MLSLSLDCNQVLKEWEQASAGIFAPAPHPAQNSAWTVPSADAFRLDVAAAKAGLSHSHYAGSSAASSYAVPTPHLVSQGTSAQGASNNMLDCDLFLDTSFDLDFGDGFGASEALAADLFDKGPLLLGKRPQQLMPGHMTEHMGSAGGADDGVGVVPCLPPLPDARSSFPAQPHLQQQQQQRQQQAPQAWQQQGQWQQQNEEGSGSDSSASPTVPVAGEPVWRGSNNWEPSDDSAVVPSAAVAAAQQQAAAQAAADAAAALAASAALVPQAPPSAEPPVVLPRTSRRRATPGHLCRSELTSLVAQAKLSVSAPVPSLTDVEVPAGVLEGVGTRAGGSRVAGAGAVASGEQEFKRTRAQCLERYREKKARRTHGKKIRYHLRKVNADKRPRVKGRFVKKEELEAYLASIGAAAAPEQEGSEGATAGSAGTAATAATAGGAATADSAAAPKRRRTDGSSDGIGVKRGAAASSEAAGVGFAGGSGVPLLGDAQHDQLLYEMLCMDGDGMGGFLEGANNLLDGLDDDDLGEEAMHHLAVVPEVPM